MHKLAVCAVGKFCPTVRSTGNISYHPSRESLSQFYINFAASIRGDFLDARRTDYCVRKTDTYENCYGRQHD